MDLVSFTSDKKEIAYLSVLNGNYLAESLTSRKRANLCCFQGSRESFKLEEILKYPLIIIIDFYKQLRRCFVHYDGSRQKSSDSLVL